MTRSHSRSAAALGALTALAGALLLLEAGPLSGAPAPLSVWLVLVGLALVWLGVDAGRRDRGAADALAARDRAESARRAADARSRELAHHTGDVLATIAADGAVSEVSEGSRELLDLAPGTLVGTQWTDLVHPGDVAATVAAMTRLARGEDDAGLTVRLRRADGAWRWAEAHLVAVRDAGALAEVQVTVRDVHARAEAERAQADAEARFRTAFEEAPIGMAIATVDGRFLQVNRALCAFTGRAQEELEGTPIVRLMHPEDRDEEVQALARLARGDAASVRGEWRWLHAAGHDRVGRHQRHPGARRARAAAGPGRHRAAPL